MDYVGPKGLHLVRRYNSSLPGWVHNYNVRVLANATMARVVRPDGRAHVFTGNGSGPWTGEIAAQEQLIRLSPDDAGQPLWKYVTATDGTEFYDANGRLISVTLRGGLSYAAQQSGGLLRGISDSFGHSLQFAYDSQNRLIRVTTPEATAITYGYDTQGRLLQVTYPDASTRQYLYESATYPLALTGLVDERGIRFASWTYDANGRAIDSQQAGGVQHYRLQYNADGSAHITDPLATSRTQFYASAGARKVFGGQSQPCAGCVGDAASNVLDTGTGLLTQSIDYLGVANLFTNDTQRKLPIAITLAAGRPEQQQMTIQWHPSFRLPVFTTEAGRITAFSYDGAGNKVSEAATDVVTTQTRTTQWTYTAQGLVETMTDPKGAVWRYGYDSAGNRVSVENPLGQRTSYSFDRSGRVNGQTDPNGLVTAYAYDARGRLTSQSVGGETSRFSYTATGQLASATLPNGYQVAYSYDDAQRLVGAQDNRGASVAYTLDPMGNRIREEVKDGRGAIALVTGRLINGLNKVTAIQGSAGQTTALAYDANGEPVTATDPLNQTTRQTLDALRRPVATTYADNTSATQAWNQLDQLTRVTDPKGVATGYQTNAFGEVVRESSPDIGGMAYQRDAAGEVIAVTDAKGATAAISRDALGRPLEVRHSPELVEHYNWDAGQAGYLARVEDHSGSTVYERDAQGRVLTKTQNVNDNPSNPSQYKQSYAYANGELASISYPSGLKVFYRRTAGRITGIDVQEPAAGSRKLPVVVPWVNSLTHTALGVPQSWSWGNGDSASRSFDADGRMTASEIASYSYDAASRITGITQSLWTQRTVTTGSGANTVSTTELFKTPVSWRAGYDSRNRLTSFVRSGAETTYGYDPNSNRLTSIETATSDVDLDGLFDGENLTHSARQTVNLDAASNRLLGFSQTLVQTRNGNPISSVTSQVNYALDANGAMTSDGLRTFDYDESRRLSKVRIIKDGEAARVSYLHNALGQRVFKSDPKAEQTLPDETKLGPGFVNWLRKNFGWLFAGQGQSISSIGMAFAYDEAGNLLGEYDNGSAAGKGRTEYIWLPTDSGQSIPVGIYKNGKFYAIHADHLGTPRLITDQGNMPVWQWPYSAFGSNKPTGVLAATVTAGTAKLKATKTALEANMRFPGQYFDEESNLSYNYFRSYNGSQGRYTQADPIGLGGGVNRFAYVGGDPLAFTDPLGLQANAAGWPLPSTAPAGTCEPSPTPKRNFCGAEGGISVPNVLSGGIHVNESCRNHDRCYGTSGSDRTACDRKFLDEMLAACANSTSPGSCRAAAYGYGAAVNTLGGAAHEAAQSQKRRANEHMRRMLAAGG